MARGSLIDGAAAAPADGIVLRHMRRDLYGAQICDMIGRVLGFVHAGGDAAADLFGVALSIFSAARRSAVPLEYVTMPATTRPLRFSLVAWPM
jgi:hypothetical protein